MSLTEQLKYMKTSFQEQAKDIIDEEIVNFERNLRTKNGINIDICSGLLTPLCNLLEDEVERFEVSRRGRRYRQVKGYLNDKLMETMILMTLYLC